MKNHADPEISLTEQLGIYITRRHNKNNAHFLLVKTRPSFTALQYTRYLYYIVIFRSTRTKKPLAVKTGA